MIDITTGHTALLFAEGALIDAEAGILTPEAAGRVLVIVRAGLQREDEECPICGIKRSAAPALAAEMNEAAASPSLLADASGIMRRLGENLIKRANEVEP